MKNARELAQNIKLKNQICKEPFTRVLELCNIQISHAEKLSKTECYFQVPEFMFGYPLYDIGECIRFLIHKLTYNDYQVQYFHPKLLFISWRIDDHALAIEEKNQENMLVNMLNALTCEAQKNYTPSRTHAHPQVLEHIPLSTQTKHSVPSPSVSTSVPTPPKKDIKVLSCDDNKGSLTEPRKRGHKSTKSVNELKAQGKLTLDLSKI